jgi:hypothetical protein
MRAEILTGKHKGREGEIVNEYLGLDPPKYLVAVEVDGTAYKFTYSRKALLLDYEIELGREMQEQRENGIMLADPGGTYRMYSGFHGNGSPVAEKEVRSAFQRRFNRDPAEVVRVTGRWWAGPLTKEEVQA